MYYKNDQLAIDGGKKVRSEHLRHGHYTTQKKLPLSAHSEIRKSELLTGNQGRLLKRSLQLQPKASMRWL